MSRIALGPLCTIFYLGSLQKRKGGDSITGEVAAAVDGNLCQTQNIPQDLDPPKKVEVSGSIVVRENCLMVTDEVVVEDRMDESNRSLEQDAPAVVEVDGSTKAANDLLDKDATVFAEVDVSGKIASDSLEKDAPTVVEIDRLSKATPMTTFFSLEHNTPCSDDRRSTSTSEKSNTGNENTRKRKDMETATPSEDKMKTLKTQVLVEQLSPSIRMMTRTLVRLMCRLIVIRLI